MNKRGKHVGKSAVARETYSRYLKNIDCEPTVNDQVALSPSTEGGEELREPTSKRKRKVSLGHNLQEHFREHWAEWFFGGVVAIVAWLMVDAKIDLARIETNAENQKGNISDLQNGEQKIIDKNQDQDLTLREHSVRLSNVEEKVAKSKK